MQNARELFTFNISGYSEVVCYDTDVKECQTLFWKNKRSLEFCGFLKSSIEPDVVNFVGSRLRNADTTSRWNVYFLNRPLTK